MNLIFKNTSFKQINTNPILIGKLLLICFCFFLPINQKVSTILIILLFLFSCFNIKKININRLLMFLPLILLYFLYVIAYYRDSFEFGIYIFERKASLIAFPIIFSTINLSKSDFKYLIKYFVYGCITVYILSFVIASYNSISIAPFEFNPVISSHRESIINSSASILLTNYYLANNFFQNMNSNFLSIYYSFALYAVLKFDTLFKHKAIIVSILVIGIIQIFSVIGLISMIIILILKVLPKSLPKIAVVLFSTFLVLISLLSLGNELREKPNYLKKLEKIESRAIIWPIAIESIRENPLFGLGIKNAQKMLESKYPKKGDFGFISQMTKKDAHNMYIQIILEIGIIGFLLFLFNIVFFIKKTKKYKYALVCKVFIFLCLTIFFTESALATYAFLSFFSFFYCLLFSISINNVNMQDY